MTGPGVESTLRAPEASSVRRHDEPVEILVVDDDADFCKTLRDVLEYKGYRVETARTGKQALRASATASYDLVLLDIELPDVEADELLIELERLAPDLEVIVITGHASVEGAVRSVGPATVGYLLKPIHMDRLFDLVRRVGERKRLRTENRRLQARINFAKRQWESTFDAISEPIAIVDGTGSLLRVNQAFCRVFGRSFQDAIRTKDWEILYGLEAEPPNWANRQAIRARTPYAEERNDLPIAGHFSITVYPLNVDGVQGAVYCLQDLTEKRKAEAALMESQTRIELLNEILAQIAASRPVSQIVRQTVRRLAELFPAVRVSYSVIDPAGQRVVLYTGKNDSRPETGQREQDLSQARGYLGLLRRGETVVVTDCSTSRLLSPARDLLEANGIRALLHEPLPSSNQAQGVLGFESSLRRHWSRYEITTLAEVAEQIRIAVRQAEVENRRARAEEGWRESEQALATLLGNLPGMAFRCRNDPDWSLEFASQGCFDLTGFKAEDLTHGSGSYANLIHPDDREAAWTDVQSSLRSGKTFRLSHRLVTHNGEVRWIWVQGRGVLTPQGEVEAVEGFAVDVTEQRRMEAQVRHQEKMAALGLLAAGAAHEIVNPLSSVSAVSQTLRRKVTDPYVTEKLDLISRHTDRICSIVRRMADFARPPRHEWRLGSVNQLLENAVTILRFDKRAKDVAIELGLTDDLPQTYLLENEMTQVFVNLGLNALDALEASSASPWLLKVSSHLAQVKSETALRVVFEDNGPGIPHHLTSRIFEPFFTTKEVGRGTGLGLAISYRTVEEHEGSIRVDSRPGRGARFVVEVPVLDRHPEAQ